MDEYTKLRVWCINHKPKDSMIWKGAWWDAYSLLDYNILPMFSKSWNENHDLDSYYKEINAMIDIVGEHWSKSIIHPVMRIIYRGVTIVFRYNFYDYNVTVISPFSLSLPVSTLFQSEKATFFHEGFPDKYVIDERYETNQSKFMAFIRNHYDFYTFMFLLKQEVDSVLQMEENV